MMALANGILDAAAIGGPVDVGDFNDAKVFGALADIYRRASASLEQRP